MIISVMAAVALAQAAASASEPIRTFEGEFRPLERSERGYAKLGPAGPFFPQRARGSGHGVIQCQVIDGGDLARCKLVSETPNDSNFAPAARILAERKRIFVTGATTGETILVRVPFVRGAPVAIEP